MALKRLSLKEARLKPPVERRQDQRQDHADRRRIGRRGDAGIDAEDHAEDDADDGQQPAGGADFLPEWHLRGFGRDQLRIAPGPKGDIAAKIDISISPGRIPAMNSRAIDCSVATP